MGRISPRDLVVAATTAVVTLTVAAAAQSPAPVIQRSTVLDWTAMAAKPTDVGSVRQFLRAPTATLKELEIHVTTLNAGLASHAPHHHPNEELVILKEGEVEVLVHGTWTPMGPGSIVFNASNEEHALRNVGRGPATYHVVNWTVGEGK